MTPEGFEAGRLVGVVEQCDGDVGIVTRPAAKTVLNRGVRRQKSANSCGGSAREASQGDRARPVEADQLEVSVVEGLEERGAVPGPGLERGEGRAGLDSDEVRLESVRRRFAGQSEPPWARAATRRSAPRCRRLVRAGAPVTGPGAGSATPRSPRRSRQRAAPAGRRGRSRPRGERPCPPHRPRRRPGRGRPRRPRPSAHAGHAQVAAGTAGRCPGSCTSFEPRILGFVATHTTPRTIQTTTMASAL